MSLRTRRILYITFIIAFFIITPLVFLYASGFDLKSGLKLQKTGTLVIDTEPKGAKIFLNNEPKKLFFNQFFLKNRGFIASPAKIKNITPGEYEVKIELENYWPWQKKLNILPGETTFAEDIKLFKKTIPLLLLGANQGVVSLSQNKKYILKIDKDSISLLNLNDAVIDNFLLATTSPVAIGWDQEIKWSPNNEKIIVGHHVFNANNFDAPLDLFLKISRQATNLKWSENDDNLLYYILDNSIHEFSLNSNSDKIIITKCHCSDYLPKYGKINLAINKENPVRPETLNSFPINIFDVPSSIYSFINPQAPLINLLDINNNLLYLLDPFSQIKLFKNTIDNVKITYWVNDDKLLYANDFEIWLYNLKNTDKTLLTRVSSKIGNIIWHPSNNYLIFTTEKDINILELDDREKYNITKLVEFKSIKKAYLNDGGDTIYFYGRIGNQEGLYKLAI